jgi:hypothetical protein
MMNAISEATIDQTLPPRRRRFVFGRAAKALTVALILALGFIAGVLVQKHQGGSSASTSGAANAPTAFAGGRGGFPGAGAGAGGGGLTVGTVANKKGHSIYVKDSNGTLVRVKVPSASTVTRSAKSKLSAIHPGDTVIVQGATRRHGTVTASTVRATAQGAGGGGGGFGGAILSGNGGAAPPGP